MDKKPIIYKYEIEPRFGEIDLYGHVNSKHYFDYVITSRWLFLEKELGMSSVDLFKKGIGFYTKKSEMNYLRPIKATSVCIAESYVKAVQGKNLIVPYEIKCQNTEKAFSKGVFTFTVIDTKTNSSCELPKWCEEYFYH